VCFNWWGEAINFEQIMSAAGAVREIFRMSKEQIVLMFAGMFVLTILIWACFEKTESKIESFG
jgi:hypothetical protein